MAVVHVWSADITYLPLLGGYLYLAAMVNLYPSHVLSWRLLIGLSVHLR